MKDTPPATFAGGVSCFPEVLFPRAALSAYHAAQRCADLRCAWRRPLQRRRCGVGPPALGWGRRRPLMVLPASIQRGARSRPAGSRRVPAGGAAALCRSFVVRAWGFCHGIAAFLLLNRLVGLLSWRLPVRLVARVVARRLWPRGHGLVRLACRGGRVRRCLGAPPRPLGARAPRRPGLALPPGLGRLGAHRALVALVPPRPGAGCRRRWGARRGGGAAFAGLRAGRRVGARFPSRGGVAAPLLATKGTL